jgi:hypothetical protein
MGVYVEINLRINSGTAVSELLFNHAFLVACKFLIMVSHE